jgi:hypothetical protein
MVRLSSKLIAAGLAAVIAGPTVLAQSPQALCAAAPAQIDQAASAQSGTSNAKKALHNKKTAVMLCKAGNAKEAQKKFKVAYTALGLDFAAAMAQAGGQAN